MRRVLAGVVLTAVLAAGQSFVAAVETVRPSVVSVFTAKVKRVAPTESTAAGLVPSEGVGSGVVIDTLGHILTCSHVVAGYSGLSVRFADGTTVEMPGVELVGRDPITDIAVIRVKTGGKLAVAVLGNSDELKVGQPVLAMGSPFGLEGSASSGIVSALGRWGFHKGSSGSDFQSFIQTDATINPGNSGGPLVDMAGRVVGVNSFMRTQRSGFTGIGFAVPSNVAADVARQLIKNGRVIRGYLGMSTQAVTADIGAAMGLGSLDGALVARVVPAGPAAQAGIKAGDVVVEFDGERVTDVRAFQTDMAATAPGTKVRLGVVRQGVRRDVTAVLGEWTQSVIDRPAVPLLEHWLGMAVTDIPKADRQRFKLEFGVLVTVVEKGSPAAEAEIEPTDIVLEMDQTPLRSVADYETVRERVKASGKPVLLHVLRGREAFYTAISR